MNVVKSHIRSLTDLKKKIEEGKVSHILEVILVSAHELKDRPLQKAKLNQLWGKDHTYSTYDGQRVSIRWDDVDKTSNNSIVYSMNIFSDEAVAQHTMILMNEFTNTNPDIELSFLITKPLDYLRGLFGNNLFKK